MDTDRFRKGLLNAYDDCLKNSKELEGPSIYIKSVLKNHPECVDVYLTFRSCNLKKNNNCDFPFVFRKN